MPKVVICLVNGWAAGGGHSLHVVCDLSLASREHARFKQTDADVGSFDGQLLADLPGQVGEAEAAVEAAHVGIGLLEPRCSALASVRSQTTCRLCPPPAAHPVTRQITTFGMNRISRCTSRMCSRPARAGSMSRRSHPRRTVSRRGPGSAGHRRSRTPSRRPWATAVSGEQHDAHVGRHPGVVEHAVQLVDGVRPERVADLGPVERHPHRRRVPRRRRW